MTNPKLAIVIGSVRPNRFAAHAAEWIEQIARPRGDFDVDWADLKDCRPPFAEEASPLYAPSKKPGRPALAGEAGQIRRLHLHCRRIQSRTHGGSEKRKRLRLCRVEQQAGCLHAEAAAGSATPARWSSYGCTPSSCRWRRSAAAVHILFADCLALVKGGKKINSELDHLNQTARQMFDQLAWPVRSKGPARRLCAKRRSWHPRIKHQASF